MRGVATCCVLALCVAGIVCEISQAAKATTSAPAQRATRGARRSERGEGNRRERGEGNRRERGEGNRRGRGERHGELSSASDQWLQILSQYAKNAASSEWPLKPFPVDLPVTGVDGRGTTLPLLVLPLPVPVRVGDGECDANMNKYSNRFEDEPVRVPYDRPQSGRRPARPDFPPSNELPDIDVMVGGVVSSQDLVAKFRAQAPEAPELPPAVLVDRPSPSSLSLSAQPPHGGGYLPPPAPRGGASPPSSGYLPNPAPRDGASPPRPRFDRSMLLRGKLTVHRADFSEPYTAWWDAGSGAARLDLHDGATSTFRTLLPDGRMRLVEMGTDRSGDREVSRCGVSTPHTPSTSDRAHPTLPDTEPFSFAGYQEGSQTEVWQHTLTTRAGEGGGARGESLTYRHELHVTRGSDGAAVPKRYSVSVDSSVLGTACDGYTHEYVEARAQDHGPTTFSVDIEGLCEERTMLDMSDADHRARLEPLREFKLPQRDPRHDNGLNKFKEQFERKYQDDTEEAVRKNLHMQHSRFVSSGNRLSASFELEVNFLGDRLDAELEVLFGVAYNEDDDDAQNFPYSEQRLRTASKDLPDEFDWRPRGGVTPVKYQDSCQSCWAFAVTGAVEGALFIRTSRLIELSEQCLVDCAHSHGAHGCNGTWPSHAYDYIRDEGLPARAEYTPYSNKVLPCRNRQVPPVTHITDHVNVKPNNVEALKVAIRKHAPSVIIVDAKAKSFIFYKKGVLLDERCKKGPKNKLNHAILAVGWGQQRGETHFIAKNTYSAAWGEGGYVRLHAPSNTCGVLSLPSYPRLLGDDPDRPELRAAAASRRDDDESL